jgi:hypothetical protein
MAERVLGWLGPTPAARIAAILLLAGAIAFLAWAGGPVPLLLEGAGVAAGLAGVFALTGGGPARVGIAGGLALLLVGTGLLAWGGQVRGNPGEALAFGLGFLVLVAVSRRRTAARRSSNAHQGVGKQ